MSLIKLDSHPPIVLLFNHFIFYYYYNYFACRQPLLPETLNVFLNVLRHFSH